MTSRLVTGPNIQRMREDAQYAGLDNPQHRPYCCQCSTMARMKPVGSNWLCDPNGRDHWNRAGCGNTFPNTKEPQ